MVIDRSYDKEGAQRTYFVGFSPAQNPKYIMAVRLDHPKKCFVHRRPELKRRCEGSNSASIAFKKAMQRILINDPEINSELKAAKKIAIDYQNRKLFKCVFEKTISGKKSFGKNTLKQFRQDIAKKSKLAESQVFIDTTTTHSMPLAPSKKESNSIILIKKEGSKITPQIIPISEIPLVSTMSGKMNILRAYTQQKNRNKVEMAAKSILGEL